MRYRDLKEERDAAVARALEAERLSMKSEFDRVTTEFELEKRRLTDSWITATQIAYRNGFNAGIEAMADDVSDCLKRRSVLVPPSLKPPKKNGFKGPTLFGEVRHGRMEAYLWWGDGPEAVTWYVQSYAAQVVAAAVEAGLRAVFGGAS